MARVSSIMCSSCASIVSVTYNSTQHCWSWCVTNDRFQFIRKKLSQTYTMSSDHKCTKCNIIYWACILLKASKGSSYFIDKYIHLYLHICEKHISVVWCMTQIITLESGSSYNTDYVLYNK